MRIAVVSKLLQFMKLPKPLFHVPLARNVVDEVIVMKRVYYTLDDEF